MSSISHPKAPLQCPVCQMTFARGVSVCPTHQTALIPGAMDSLIGHLLAGRFRVGELVGQGGNGCVYRGVQTAVDRPVAIKVMPLTGHTQAAELRFEAEARILGRLRHPNTLRLIDHGRLADGRAWIVTPFLRGETLRERLSTGPLTGAETRSLLQQVASALEETHEAGVVHRDLKPANLFLEDVSGRSIVRLLDFGIAQQDEDVRVTAEGQVVGTSTYMSPEQIRGERVDARSDLYSLGVVAYECVTGRAPFEGPNRISVVMQHLNDAPEPLPADSGLADLIGWCLEKRAGDRPPHATAVLDAIEDLGVPSASPPAEPDATIRHRWLLTGVLLGIAVMGAFIGWTWQPVIQPHPDTPHSTPVAVIDQRPELDAAALEWVPAVDPADAANLVDPVPDAAPKKKPSKRPPAKRPPAKRPPAKRPPAKRPPRSPLPSAPRPPEGLF